MSRVEKRHSGSRCTEQTYCSHLERFCNFLRITPNEIVNKWKAMKYDLKQRDHYIDEMLENVDAFEHYLGKEGLCNNSVSSYLSSLQSFFKYMRIPVRIETFTTKPAFHNRDITKDEIQLILSNSTPRDKAFYLMMLQAGLRPATLMKLTYALIKKDFEANRTPCIINVPCTMSKGEYKDYFTFVGPETVNALKMYFAKRGVPKDNETVFEGPKTASAYSMRFGYYVRTLGLIKPENMRPGRKPQPLRLYCLRKYFRKMASPAGTDFVNFWMGHTLGIDEHYFSRDPEYHRKAYAEKAMPNLRISEPSALETEKTIMQLREQLESRNREIEELQNGMKKIQPLIDFAKSFPSKDELELFLTDIKKMTIKTKEGEEYMVIDVPRETYNKIREAGFKDPDELLRLLLRREEEKQKKKATEKT